MSARPKNRKDKTHDVTIYRVERTTNSVNGNPRFKLHTSGGTFATQTDAGLGYDIGNMAHDNRDALNNGEGIAATLTTTPADRVFRITIGDKTYH